MSVLPLFTSALDRRRVFLARWTQSNVTQRRPEFGRPDVVRIRRESGCPVDHALKLRGPGGIIL
jgi:hypothetical protein